jgi:hypothetical protein
MWDPHYQVAGFSPKPELHGQSVGVLPELPAGYPAHEMSAADNMWDIVQRVIKQVSSLTSHCDVDLTLND